MLISIKKKEIKRACEAAISKLAYAPLKEEGDYVKIFFVADEKLHVSVMGGNSTTRYFTPFPFTVYEGIELARVRFVHPCYESEKYMQESGVETTEENIREWDWNNYTESNDFSFAVECLEEQVITFLEREFQDETFEIEVI